MLLKVGRKVSFLFLLFIILFCTNINAYTERNFLEKKATLEQIKSDLIMNQKWIKFPSYTNRQAWDSIFGDFKSEYIKRGEKQLNYQWKVVKATDYLEYERSGSRRVMENPFESNYNAFSDLLMAELAEGKGRFIDQIINGVYYYCEMTSWALSTHLQNAQETHRAIPDYRENIIELTSGNIGALLSWTYYYLKGSFDKVDPVISLRLRKTLQDRILTPYMNRDYWWMAMNYKPGRMVNNWNPWCNSNVLTCYMILENDKDVLAKAVYRTMQSVDKFINYTKADGACEEGPSYWEHASGMMFEYLDMLSNVTGGKVSIFNEPMIKNMGEYISRSYVANDWVVNFADASAKSTAVTSFVYRFGKAVKSEEMMQFAAMINKNEPPTGVYFYRNINALLVAKELNNTSKQHIVPDITWYPQTQVCMIRDSKTFMAAKGGNNNESHNHNDVGSFSFWMNNTPLIIDAGVGTYTRQTFTDERYSIWTMQSNYHNLPMINGIAEKNGAQYKAESAVVNERKKSFVVNIATAYPKEANVDKWVRTYSLRNNVLHISDSFSLKSLKESNQVNFMSWGNINVSTPGKVYIQIEKTKAVLEYDSAKFSVKLEEIPLNDIRLSHVWGSKINRIRFVAKDKQIKGNYLFLIKEL